MYAPGNYQFSFSGLGFEIRREELRYSDWRTYRPHSDCQRVSTSLRFQPYHRVWKIVIVQVMFVFLEQHFYFLESETFAIRLTSRRIATTSLAKLVILFTMEWKSLRAAMKVSMYVNGSQACSHFSGFIPQAWRSNLQYYATVSNSDAEFRFSGKWFCHWCFFTC